jgi:ribose 5-phosphate isomerase B
MKIAVGSDHAGFELKEHVRRRLEDAGHEVMDMGTRSKEPVDYPEYARRVAEAVAGGKADRGVVVCGTGIGAAMAANRVRGARAAPCTIEYAAEMARRHNDANVLALGERIVTREVSDGILDIFLSTAFEGGRHARRVAKIEPDEG